METCLPSYSNNLDESLESLREFEKNEKMAAILVNNSDLSVYDLKPLCMTKDDINFKSSINRIEQLLNYVLKNQSKNIFNQNSKDELKINFHESKYLDFECDGNNENYFLLSSENSLNENFIRLQKTLEKEISKRQHCEKEIQNLNDENLDLQKQLAVLNGLERKYMCFINKFVFPLKQVSSIIFF